jgi:hypothetical protein
MYMLQITRLLVFLITATALLHPSIGYSAEPTSKTNARLLEAIKQFPDADANSDGVLTLTEAKAYLQKRRNRRSAQGRKQTGPDLATIEKSGNGLWVASTGHSLVAPALGPFEAAARVAGYEGHLQVRQLSGGATGAPRAHWEKPEAEQVVKRALTTGKCDVLTMGSHYEGSEVEDFARWIDLALKHNPDIDIFIMDAWPYLTDLLDVRAKKTTDADATLEPYQQKMAGINERTGETVDRLNEKYPGKVHVIPIGSAMLELVRRQLAGELPGVDAVYAPGKKGENASDGRVGLYRDQIHPTNPVAVLEGYLYYACLYKKNPLELSKELYKNPQLDRILREVAWKTVTEHPRSGVMETMAAGSGQ